MANPFLDASRITKTFAGIRALDEVDIQIGRGEVRCLLGENGSGKSTLIKVLGGVHRPDSGTISIEGRPHGHLSAIESIRAGIQVIHQHLSLFPNLTVAENIAINQLLEARSRFVAFRDMRRKAEAALAEIGEDLPLAARVEDLSMAKRQLVAISRSLTQNARLIIMDEATSALTRDEVDHLFRVIMRLRDKGISVLFVSHKLTEVFEVSESVTILRDGRKVGDFLTRELNNDRLVFHMTGREFESRPYRFEAAAEGAPLLEVTGLSRRGRFQDVGFSLRSGEILGITGLIGAGRSELALALFGLEPADSGEIRIDGRAVAIRRPEDAIRLGIALLPEDRLSQGLFLPETIRDNIVVTVLDRLLGRAGLLDRRKLASEGVSWVDRLKIKTPSPLAQARTLSGGNQQRVVLAKWLATRPRIFILDGPTVGIDIGSKHNIHAIIRDLAGQGMGIIVISDEIPELMDNCNRILVMAEGRIIGRIPNVAAATEDEVRVLIDRRAAAVEGA
jgi:simple sugar transport system ATP-binding protein